MRRNTQTGVALHGFDSGERGGLDGELCLLLAPMKGDQTTSTVIKISSPNAMSLLLNERDVATGLIAESRAPNELSELESSKWPERGVMSAPLAKERDASAGGIRNTTNPHTTYAEPASPCEEGRRIGGTGVEDIARAPKGSRTKSVDDVGTKSFGATTGTKRPQTETGYGSGTHVLGISMRGGGDGIIMVDERGRVMSAEAWSAAAGDRDAVAAGKKDDKEGRGLSRLWSRESRTSSDGKRRGSVDEAGGRSPNSMKRVKSLTSSRFNEEPTQESESNSTPASPSSSRFKVPLKDKIKGELKVISGKMSKNDAKVEQGIALMTGNARATH